MSKKPSVLVVGAGPTGLVLAHELARDGIQCRLIDQGAHRATQSRAIAIHSRTLETFELMGVADDFLAAGQRIAAVDLYGKGGAIAHNSFESLATRYPFVLGVPQDETERILEQHVALHGVRVERNTKLVGLEPHEASVIAQLDNGDLVEQIEADWLVGCDGAHSSVRDQLAMPFAGSTYPEHFVLADVKVRGDLDHSAAQVWLHEDGAVAFFPLPEGRHRLIVANAPADWHQEPSLAQCQALVDERGPDGIQLTDPRWAAVFRIHRREAARFRQDRIFLAGDAAHIHSPVGGQGMNIGIRDAFNLAWKLTLVNENLASPTLLDSYEAERKPVDQAVIRQTDRATRLVSLHGSISRFVRDHLISLATRLPAVQERIGEAVSGIAVNYRHSPVIEEHSVDGTGPRAGDRAPDAPIEDAAGRASLRLYDLFAERRHTLLLLGKGGEDLAALLPDIPECRFTIRRITAPPTAGSDLIDHAGMVAAQYGSAPAAYLIRPDGYIGFRCPISEVSARLPRYLGGLFGGSVKAALARDCQAR